MQISGLTLANFRCFEFIELSLSPSFTLLLGDNGAGKTALLEGLAVALGAFVGEIRDAQSRNIREADDARLGRRDGLVVDEAEFGGDRGHEHPSQRGALGDHPLHRQAQDQEGAVEIGRLTGAPFGQLQTRPPRANSSRATRP